MFSIKIGICVAFPADEFTETAVKAWKRCFLTELQTSQPFFCLFVFCLCDRLTGSNFYCYFLTIEQSTGHVQVEKNVFSVWGLLYIYIIYLYFLFLRVMSVFSSNNAYGVVISQLF